MRSMTLLPFTPDYGGMLMRARDRETLQFRAFSIENIRLTYLKEQRYLWLNATLFTDDYLHECVYFFAKLSIYKGGSC